jgi:adenine-specific DNA-methyltransferase
MAKAKSSVTVDAIRHNDTRKNIPTSELRDFMAEEETKPRTMLYPRDPSLDPQLVWQGKDEQDSTELAVPVVPIYIQEKIHPRAIIDALPREDTGQQQLDLFADFNGIDDFDKKVDFYHHDQHWTNRMVLGDSLLVMTSLAEKEGLKGKVQTIYLDPPYGIKFGSNWQVSTRKRDVKDGKAEDATRQPEQVRAFRDTWKLGIHSYLAYLRDRLVVARELLTETGSVFVQIGDENVHLVRCLLDEVFGSENFISQIAIRTTMGAGSQSGVTALPAVTSYILWYGQESGKTKIRDLFEAKADMQSASLYSLLKFADGTERRATAEEISGEVALPVDASLFRPDTLTSQSPRNDGQFPIEIADRVYTPGRGYWKTNREGMMRLKAAGRLRPTAGDSIQYVRFLDDFPVVSQNNFWPDGLTGSFTEDKVYVVQSPTKIVARCLLLSTDPGDLVLDPTCGSGTTAYVAEQWGRRWITIDTSRVALALARTRLMAARYPYYLLADSPEGINKEAELTDKRPATYQTNNDIRKGFVYKRVPHIMLKDIANNAEIDEIHARFQPQLDALLSEINGLAGQQWQEWEIPRTLTPQQAKIPKLQASLDGWWQVRRERQAQIDASIARNAATEYLYDQPYEDAKCVRVSGPFTVESLSPHRVLSTDENLDGVVSPQEEARVQDFTTMILENLKAAGIQNTRKEERLKFDRLDPYSSGWLHATGEYTDADSQVKRVAVSIGPEHGTVGAQQIKEAAKEAMQGLGFDMLIVCGFAFDAHAGETANEFKPVDQPVRKGIIAEQKRHYGKLPVMLARMNPDLTMGDELLKKTGAGNLFMVFGEPDVDIRRDKAGQVTVEIKGVDVYDPTTGQIRSSSTDEIACWFIDTDYDGEGFFVRHAYFTGADEPYEKLKRALRAEIDEAAWASIYSTTSRPFARPTSGKIAVKVINHYGDEVLKVYSV